MSIGKRIKELKTILKLTSLDLSKELNIPVRTIGSYERDEAIPSAKFFQALLEIKNINANWLISGKGSMFLEKEPQKIVSENNLINISEAELMQISTLLESEASREMVLKLAEIKKGNKEALDSLIQNLQGIKAIL